MMIIHFRENLRRWFMVASLFIRFAKRVAGMP